MSPSTFSEKCLIEKPILRSRYQQISVLVNVIRHYDRKVRLYLGAYLTHYSIPLIVCVHNCLITWATFYSFQSPETQSTTTSAPSVTLRAAVTSLEKSTCPGESIRLMRKPLMSCSRVCFTKAKSLSSISKYIEMALVEIIQVTFLSLFFQRSSFDLDLSHSNI